METEKFYHIYNHANGIENLFKEEENFRYFLQQWDKYISPVADTYAYCLMPNHIHFLVQIKNDVEILNLGGFQNLQGLDRTSKIISKKFSNLFNSYTKAFNTRYQRRGSLFTPNFKRKEITSEDYLKTLVCYIHRNPIHHGFCTNFTDWEHSSYHSYLSDKSTKIKRQFILDLFDGKDNFIAAHQQQIEHLDTDYFLE